MRLGCVIMASGAGRRFARAGGAGNKLLAPLADTPLIVRTVASVPPALFETVVSTRWREVADAVARAGLGAGVALHTGELRSESVRAGLRALGAPDACPWDGCLFLPGDQPLVGRGSFEALATAFAHDPRRAYRLAWRGAPGSPVLFPRGCFPALMRLAGMDGGAGVLCSGAVAVEHIEAARAEELWDVDVPGDLARLEERIGS